MMSCSSWETVIKRYGKVGRTLTSIFFGSNLKTVGLNSSINDISIFENVVGPKLRTRRVKKN